MVRKIGTSSTRGFIGKFSCGLTNVWANQSRPGRFQPLSKIRAVRWQLRISAAAFIVPAARGQEPAAVKTVPLMIANRVTDILTLGRRVHEPAKVITGDDAHQGPCERGDMPSKDSPSGPVDQLLDTADLADALESDRFKQFLDQVPVAIAVSVVKPEERIVYANFEFARLTHQANNEILGGGWDLLPGVATDPEAARSLGEAVTFERDYVGAFAIPHDGSPGTVDAWSNVIEDDDGTPEFRLVALVKAASRATSVLDELQRQVREKDMQLRELQHRVKNNLQMITALIRVEAQGVTDRSTGEGFDRLAGRVESLGLLYRALGEAGQGDEVDLGVYLSEIASAVMRAHAVEGIRLDLKVERWLASIDVAMPTGLVVNELLTNALKHAFQGRRGGVITLSCTSDDTAWRVVVADDGVGLPDGLSWPKPGKLSALIVRSLLQNANATIDVESEAGRGMQVTILFNRQEMAQMH
jgi:two-component sensor histidine kinase